MEVRKLQSNMYKILLETTKILTDNEIPYYLSDGSMLGAVRHNGFIPWDDDTDISLKRSDYNKALKILSDNLDSEIFFIQNYHTDKNFPHTFTRICLRNSVAKQRNWQFLNMNHLIFMDIFPLDRVSNDEDLSNKAKRIDTLIKLKGIKAKHFVVHKTKPQSLKQKIQYFIKYILFFLLKPISMVSLNKRQEHIQVSNDTDSEKYVTLYFGTQPNLHNLVLTNSELNNLMTIKFEKDNLYIPISYHSILTKTYGTYMEYPDINKRVGNHDFIELRLDERYTNLLD